MHAAGVFTARFAELDVERRMSAEGRYAELSIDPYA
jgi:hypothetical protein